MSHVEVSVHFLEGSVFVTEVATLAIGAEAFSVELSAVLRLIFVVVATLLLLIEVEVMLFAQLIHSMSVLTLVAVATEASFSPILAEFSLVHGPLNESLVLLDRRLSSRFL